MNNAQTDCRNVSAVLGDARWFPESFDPPTGRIAFVETDASDLAEQVFLDDRWNNRTARRAQIHVFAAAKELAGDLPPRNINFIWHTGFCCSTLLAKSLNAPVCNLSLCEPRLLVDVARAKRDGAFALHPALAQLPKIAFNLLGRGFEDGGRIVIKPAPAANCLIADAAALTSGRHLFLYSDCRAFLVSLARMGRDGALYAREMFGLLLRDACTSIAMPPDALRRLTDLQIGALVWHMQIAEFRRRWDSLGPPRVRSLDCDVFLAAPERTLEAAGDFFGLGFEHDHFARVVSGPAFQRNAKQPGHAFNADRRREEHDVAARQLGDELEDVVSWSYETHPQTPRGMPLSESLVPNAKEYS